jgi:transaldolase
MDFMKNVLALYRENRSNVEVLSASVRNMDHFMYALALESDIITAPYRILAEWADKGTLRPDEKYEYNNKGLKPIEKKNIDLDQAWDKLNIKHELTDNGIEKFAADWNKLIKR